MWRSYVRVCTCVHLRVHEGHLPDQKGRVALFVVARYCEVSVGGAAVWIGPVLVTLHLQTHKALRL